MSLTVTSTATEIITLDQLDVVIKSSESALSSFIEKHKNVSLEPKNSTELAQVEAAWREFYYPRLEIEKKVKDTVSSVYKQYKEIKEKGESIILSWKAQESKFKSILSAEEERKKAEKAAKVEAELARCKAIRAAIEEIRNTPLIEALSDSGRLQKVFSELELKEVTKDIFAEFLVEAEEVKAQALAKLLDLINAKIQAEEVAKAQKIEAERLAKERAEFEAQKAAQEEADRRRQTEAQALIDAETARIKAEQEAQRKAIQAQQDEIYRHKKEIEDKKKAELLKKQAEEEERKVKEYWEWVHALSLTQAFEEIDKLASTNVKISDICRAQLAKLALTA